MNDDQTTRRQVLQEQIRHIVKQAEASGEMLRTSDQAGVLAAIYIDAFSIREIVDLLLRQASEEGVAVEIGRPE